MGIDGFRYGWRFNYEKYARLSESELSHIQVLSQKDSQNKWGSIVETESFYKKRIYSYDCKQNRYCLLKGLLLGER